MSVQWGEPQRAAQDDVAGSLRCLVYWILPSALLGATAIAAGLVWLAARIGG